ncbi:MAG: DEAD/DEAH box helicase family protein [Prolixibacteraceae bacterium]|nr:DEAD/DEAH box helicase family protein [Prolixibacteraceae bacterium]
MAFNENSRVKLPALVHLCKLGYNYISEKKLKQACDPDTNINIDVLKSKLHQFNPLLKPIEIDQFFDKLKIVLDNDDLGREFYNIVSANSGIKLIDFEHIANNDFDCTTELTCKNGEDEFRPDITLYVNGLPLAIIEVKKPNNKEGVLKERDRINVRFKNRKFRRFLNLSQVMLFSNNMEYDHDSIVPIQGAFYSTNAKDKATFNCFREKTAKNEEGKPNFYKDFTYLTVPDSTENFILTDNNSTVIKHTPEYKTNKSVNTPTNRVITSLFSKERFLFALRYAIAYVDTKKEIDDVEVQELQKHIMRYQQMFATFAIKQKLSEGVKSGIIWHTQGSGKTALAFYNVKHLTDYYASLPNPVVPKFYFIVDRIDLLTQAKIEFEERGLTVNTVSDRDELMKQFRSQTSIFNQQGKLEITVVNIQKFKEDQHKVKMDEYAINLQRIYFLDEAHRGYKPDGCFLANLFDSDRDAIKIALTGTPLIGEEKNSCKVFGDYIDTYYYNQSIADGYTLKLMREDIESNYRMEIEKVLEEVQLKRSDIKKERIIADPRYVEALLNYITADLIKSRTYFGDQSMAGMIVCDSNPQARVMFQIFNEKQSEHHLQGALILHDEDDKETRKGYIEDFKKKASVDLLIVNIMLLTGFDAPRLKKLYLGRTLRDHNLLQALTRVNRPYNKFKYGYIVDFADIKDAFDATNEAYLKELKKEVGEENIDTYSCLFESNEEIIEQMKDIKEVLFGYNCTNAEEFSLQMNEIDDREKLLTIKKSLEQAKSLANVVRTFGDPELKEQFAKLAITKVNDLFSEVSHRLDTVNLKSSLQNQDAVNGIINEAMATITFSFTKVKEEELRMLSDDYTEAWQRTWGEFNKNFDQTAEEFISLAKVFREYFKDKNIEPASAAEARERIGYMDSVMEKIREINKRNSQLKQMYNNDEKFARAHKRVVQRGLISKRESEVCDNLNSIKQKIDEKVLLRRDVLRNDPYFEQTVLQLISIALSSINIKATVEEKQFITAQISNEYLTQYHNQQMGHEYILPGMKLDFAAEPQKNLGLA